MDTNLHIQKLYSKPSYRLPHTEPPQQMAPQRIESQFKPVRDLQQIKKKLIQIKLIAYNTPYSSHELNFLFNEIIYVEYPLFLIFMPLFKALPLSVDWSVNPPTVFVHFFLQRKHMLK